VNPFLFSFYVLIGISSGPKRYNYDMETKTWRNTRDGHDMLVLLSRELSHLLGFEVKLKEHK